MYFPSPYQIVGSGINVGAILFSLCCFFFSSDVYLLADYELLDYSLVRVLLFELPFVLYQHIMLYNFFKIKVGDFVITLHWKSLITY